eukprot:scaffold2885_cov155-Skeletonema_marinoi.AAC.1
MEQYEEPHATQLFQFLAMQQNIFCSFFIRIRDSIVASIPACHAGDRGSIPRLGALRFAQTDITYVVEEYLLLV